MAPPAPAQTWAYRYCVERRQRPAAHFGVPQLAIARRIFQLRQQIEGDVRRLIVGRIGARDVGAQRSDGGFARESRAAIRRPPERPQRARRPAPWRWIPRILRRPKSVPRRKYSGASAIAASASSSAGPLIYVLRCTCPKRRNSAFSRPGNHAQHALLLAEAHVILESDQVELPARAFSCEAAPPRRAAGRCADRSAPSASSVRSAACRVRAARSLRSAGRLRNSATLIFVDVRRHALGRKQRVQERLVLRPCRTGSSDNRRCRRAIFRSATPRTRSRYRSTRRRQSG